MDFILPQHKAKELLETYEGFNNQLLDWKGRIKTSKNFMLTKSQSDYILKYHEITPKVARKYVKLVESFGVKLMEDKQFLFPVEQIWVEKILCDTDKAYHIYGRYFDNDKLEYFWIPKMAIIKEEKKLNRIIDYSIYDKPTRTIMEHQKVAIEKLLVNNRFILADDMGLGKGLTVNTYIYTHTGKTKIGELNVGDKVIGSDGKPYNVTGVFPQGLKQTYKITFNDGFSVNCDEDHLWEVTFSEINTLVLSTKELLDKKGVKWFVSPINIPFKMKTYYKPKSGEGKWRIPTVKPIEFAPFNDTIKNCYLYGFNFFKYRRKSIPNEYKYSTIENRIELLQGLLDSKGQCRITKKNKCSGIEFITNSKQISDDVAELVQTLGGLVTIKYIRKEFLKFSPENIYKLMIKLPDTFIPFKNVGKLSKFNLPKTYEKKRCIVNIEQLDIQETVCISVDSPDKLYVAEHCIVTHNTTSATIASIESNVKKTLIICPASLKINWKREIEIYTDKKIIIIDGNKWPKEDYDYYIVNYDILKNFHSLDKKGEDVIFDLKFDLSIVDESHFLSNNSSQRSQIANEILNKIPKVWLLSGTPMTSRPINMFNLLKIVESPLALNWQHYVKRYCNGFQFKVKGKKIWKVDGASNLEELRERIKDVFLRRLKTDVLDLPDKTITPIYLELKNKVFDDEFESLRNKINTNQYKIIELDEEERENTSLKVDIRELMKLRQLIALEKMVYTVELIDKYLETGVKIVVLTNFTLVIDYLKEKYKKNSVVLDGRMNKKQKQISVDRFQNEDSIKLFFGNIKAAGVGITLTAAEILIMNDLSFVPGDHSQGEDRSHRIGQDKKVTIFYPIFENTFEKVIYNMIQLKKNNIDTALGDNYDYETFIKELFS